MRKLLALILCSIILWGCSSSITKTYPRVEDDFREDDYKQLKELSDDEKLSYEDLCQKFVETNLNNDAKSIIENLDKEGLLSNIQCKKTENDFTISYDINIGNGSVNDKTNMIIVTGTKDYSLNNVTIYTTDVRPLYVEKIISIIENSKDSGSNIYSTITEDEHIDNKLYTQSPRYYYLPIETNELAIYSSLQYIDKSYQSYSNYVDHIIEQNDKELEELEKNLDKVERDITNIYGSPRKAARHN